MFTSPPFHNSHSKLKSKVGNQKHADNYSEGHWHWLLFQTFFRCLSLCSLRIKPNDLDIVSVMLYQLSSSKTKYRTQYNYHKEKLVHWKHTRYIFSKKPTKEQITGLSSWNKGCHICDKQPRKATNQRWRKLKLTLMFIYSASMVSCLNVIFISHIFPQNTSFVCRWKDLIY